MWLFATGILLYAVALIKCEVGDGRNPMDMDQVMDYFQKYHYMGSNMPDPVIAELMKTNMSMAVNIATRLFQQKYRDYGLTVTGDLDPATMALMSLPRCGVADIISMEDMAKRTSRYVLKGDKWYTSVLTYKIRVYPRDKDLTVSQVDREIARAFRVWQKVIPLSFKRLRRADPTAADIDIEFSYRDHGDGNAFDGPSGTLAHAFFPGQGKISGDTHFDEAETWTINSYTGTNLFQVAAHEFGHALGLGHSGVKSALMAPFYSGYIPNFKLPSDDIRGIQAKYGPPKKQPPKVPSWPTAATAICAAKSFNAITTMIDNGQKKTYGFKGKYYFLIDDNGLAKSYPRLIKSGIRGLPNNIDAALFWDAEHKRKWDRKTRKKVKTLVKKAATYIFNGAQYWKVEGMRVLAGYPKHISDWGIPAKIDAAFVNKRDGHTYFLKGSKYYRYVEGVGIRGGAKPLSSWKGMPSNIDASLQSTNRKTYFFKGSQFYLYNSNKAQVAPGYPRSNEAWLGCARIKKSTG